MPTSAQFVFTVVILFSGLSLALSVVAILSLNKVLRTARRLSDMEDSLVRSVMEEGGDASVEAVLQTMERIMDMDDGRLGAEEALKQARDMHKR